MNIEQRLVGDVTVLSIDGDITTNHAGAPPIADTIRQLMQQGRRRFILDMGRVRYVDSTGLGTLVQSFSAVKNRGGALRLVNVTRRLNDLLVLARLLTVFDCFDTEAEAVASFEAHLTRS